MNYYKVEAIETPQRQREFVAQCDLALEQNMERVAKQIVAAPELRLLGLTGPTCSGKTTAANKLTDYFEKHGHRVHVISIDDFYYDKDYLNKRAEEDPDIEVDYDSEDTIDIELLSAKTESLLACKETRMPRFDFQTGYRTEGAVLTPQKDDIFLFEGIQILYPKVHAILRGEAYRSIYICPSSSIQIGDELFEPNELRLMRRLVRDFRYRATDPEFTLYLWQSVRENEEKNIFPNAHFCHDVIDSTMPYEVGMLKPYLEEILPQILKTSEFYGEAQTILQSISAVPVIPSDYMTPNSLYKEFI